MMKVDPVMALWHRLKGSLTDCLDGSSMGERNLLRSSSFKEGVKNFVAMPGSRRFP